MTIQMNAQGVHALLPNWHAVFRIRTVLPPKNPHIVRVESDKITSTLHSPNQKFSKTHVRFMYTRPMQNSFFPRKGSNPTLLLL